MYRKRRWPAIAAGYGVFCLALSALTAFVYENVTPVNRATVVRSAVTFTLAVILIHLRRSSRGDPLWEPPSNFENALAAEQPPAKLHPEFARLRDEVSGALARRSNFERGLWPRLVKLSLECGGTIEPWPMPQRRGPSVRQLSDLIGRIEGSK